MPRASLSCLGALKMASRFFGEALDSSMNLFYFLDGAGNDGLNYKMWKIRKKVKRRIKSNRRGLNEKISSGKEKRKAGRNKSNGQSEEVETKMEVG